uniref:Helitron helicase n=1 Tax=Bursaphelenchus xylophilus TaxID=6326 RepID=A0A1I7SRY6_BURXY
MYAFPNEDHGELSNAVQESQVRAQLVAALPWQVRDAIRLRITKDTLFGELIVIAEDEARQSTGTATNRYEYDEDDDAEDYPEHLYEDEYKEDQDDYEEITQAHFVEGNENFRSGRPQLLESHPEHAFGRAEKRKIIARPFILFDGRNGRLERANFVCGLFTIYSVSVKENVSGSNLELFRP